MFAEWWFATDNGHVIDLVEEALTYWDSGHVNKRHYADILIDFYRGTWRLQFKAPVKMF
jgi:hypothetical protein